MNEYCAELVKERPRRHEITGFHDDRRQDDGEKELRVELDDAVAIAGEECYDSKDNADYNQQAALWEILFQHLAGMKRWKEQ